MCERLPERTTLLAENKYDLDILFKLIISLCINYLVWNHITFPLILFQVTLKPKSSLLFFSHLFTLTFATLSLPFIHFMMHAFRFESVTCDARMFFKVVIYFFRMYWLIPCALLVFGTWSKTQSTTPATTSVSPPRNVP